MKLRSDLAGMCLFVTGAASGIGCAVVEAALADGADVVGLARNDAERNALRTLLPDARILLRDLVADGPDRLVAEATARLGRLDGLVSAAGLFDHRAGLETSQADFEATLALNLTAGFVLARDAGQAMQAGGGSIVLLSSQIGLIGHARAAAYAASKAGINGLAKALALEFAPRAIRVNAVAPGPIATPMTAAARADPERNARMLASIPLGRFGEAGEVAASIRFLLSPAAAFITGHILVIDGGVTAS